SGSVRVCEVERDRRYSRSEPWAGLSQLDPHHHGGPEHDCDGQEPRCQRAAWTPSARKQLQ
ncbi:MAG: hypothetical protein OXR73_15580, partial [Myxococcales bacterium]|nr:hypothetical protein [Myxococcales bacterium]